ncbi:TolC family protein [Burkholderia cenocepacia]|uniref:TolC family protein n=1 Tax=Burkholderia cenocepacia TaxID=95486 RepID=UPI00345335F1
MQAAADAIRHVDALLQHASLAFDAEQARYRAGVASMVELLRTQDALFEARRERIQTLSDWYVARLSLAADLGTLSMSDIHVASDRIGARQEQYLDSSDGRDAVDRR